MYTIKVLSRHPSHRILRQKLPKLPVRSLIRLGSTTELKDGKNRIEINSADSIKISANKRLMKEAFDSAGCSTAPWTNADSTEDLFDAVEDEKVRFPIVAKHIYGSRGTGNSLLRNEDQFVSWAVGRNFQNYIFENYMSYLLEFRAHMTKSGCFYTCRKGLVRTTEPSERWRRHKDNSVWILATNPDFHRPNSWNDIVETCIKALNEIGADVLSFDIRVQSSVDKDGKEREYQQFILLEANSASSLCNPNKDVSICAEEYIKIIPHLIMEKANI